LAINYTFHKKINRVFLIGDSAGGNLVLSLTNFLVINKLKVPDKIILIYPGNLTSDHPLLQLLLAQPSQGLL
jgi:acetyl esterase/lipase